MLLLKETLGKVVSCYFADVHAIWTLSTLACGKCTIGCVSLFLSSTVFFLGVIFSKWIDSLYEGVTFGTPACN